MSVPIQVWAPFLQYSPLQQEFLRDFHRAQEVWHGEDRVWLLSPSSGDIAGVSRWQTMQSNVKLRECLLQGEQLNCYDIFYVDECRRLYPVLGKPDLYWNTLPEGLYRQWVNTPVQSMPASSYFDWQIPRLSNGRVAMSKAKVFTKPGAVVPLVTIMDGGQERVVMGWPPPGWKGPMPVSPETGNPTIYGELRRDRVREGTDEIDVVLTERDPTLVATPFWPKWTDEFGAMFPLGGGVDLLYHRALMRRCIQNLADGQRAQAMQVIRSWAHRLTGEAEATIEAAWLLPKCSVNIDAALADVEGRFNIEAKNLSQLADSKDYHRVMGTLIPVRRTHGWLGYLWWEMYQDVQNRVAIRFCRNCGNVIRGGRADRQYCTQLENPACGRSRNEVRQKARRAAKRRDSRRPMSGPEWV